MRDAGGESLSTCSIIHHAARVVSSLAAIRNHDLNGRSHSAAPRSGGRTGHPA
jgi:hypothetical protein